MKVMMETVASMSVVLRTSDTTKTVGCRYGTFFALVANSLGRKIRTRLFLRETLGRVVVFHRHSYYLINSIITQKRSAHA